MADIRIFPAAPADAQALAPLLRPEDAAESWALDGREPVEGLLDSLQQSARAWAASVDGEPAAMWGVVPIGLLTGTAVVWLVTGQAVDRNRVTFLKECRRRLAEIQHDYPILVNVIHAKYTRAVRWATWLGFDVSKPFVHGPDGEPFVRIERRA